MCKENEEYKQLNLLHNYKKRKEKEMTKKFKINQISRINKI